LICADCDRSLLLADVAGEIAPGTFDSALAVYEYAFPLDRLIQRFKYGGDLAVGRWLALRLLARVIREPRPDVIVAPPLTAARLRERGFNQALEIAKVVASGLGVACELAALSRTRETSPQPGLGRRERRANLAEAFECRRGFDGSHVALVDDVITTGATAESIARVLKEAGAARVSVWAVAHTPGPMAQG
jgi:ComF family protein